MAADLHVPAEDEDEPSPPLLEQSLTTEQAWEAIPLPWRPLYEAPAKLPFDPSCYDFVTPVRAMLECPEGVPLSKLHEVQREPGFQACPPLRKGMVLAGIPMPKEATRSRPEGRSSRKNKKDWTQSTAYIQFFETYRRFVREVVLPEYVTLRDANAEPEDVVQASPVLRVVMPSEHFATKAHRDGDYGHVPQELNYWIPLSPVFGSNSLFAESFPDRGDYEAFEGDNGDVFRWWGNRCQHYAAPNRTDCTRVSLDFRVVPGPLWASVTSAVKEAALAGRTLKHLGELRLGSYYMPETALQDARIPAKSAAVAPSMPASSLASALLRC